MGIKTVVSIHSLTSYLCTCTVSTCSETALNRQDPSLAVGFLCRCCLSKYWSRLLRSLDTVLVPLGLPPPPPPTLWGLFLPISQSTALCWLKLDNSTKRGGEGWSRCSCYCRMPFHYVYLSRSSSTIQLWSFIACPYHKLTWAES